MRILILAILLCVASSAHAIVVTPTQNTTSLVNALLGAGGTGIVVTNVTLLGHAQAQGLEEPFGPETSSGTFTNGSGTYGIGSGVVLSTGAVENYGDGANTSDQMQGIYWTISPVQVGIPATPAQETLLDPITTVGEDTYDHFDVTELIVTFNMQSGVSYVAFNVVFGSEEYPEYAEVGYFDGFGMLLNGTNVAFVNAQPVNITHPAMAELAGTELDGVLAPGNNPLLVFGGPVNPTSNTLRFIIGDREDPILDSTVYVSGLRGTVPEPSAIAVGAAAVGALGTIGRARRIR